MIRACLIAALALLLGPAWGAPSAKPAPRPALLWISMDITPAARLGLIEREAAAAGVALATLDYPLRTAALEPAQQRELERALAGAQAVWIDAPHASVEAKLQALLGEALKRQAGGKPLTWIPAGEPAAGAHELRAYLQAGGRANTQAAFALLKAQLARQPAPELPAPVLLPQRGLYHPDFAGAGHILADAPALERWLAARGEQRPAVALLLHRYHFVQGNTAWVDQWLRLFEQQGLFAYAVFSSHLAGDSLAPLMEDRPGHLQARVIVNHALLPQAGGLQPLFERWGAPLLQTLPYRNGDSTDWEASEPGLAQTDLPFYYAQPEGAGAIDPLLVVAHANKGRDPQLIVRQAEAVVAKARRLIALQSKPPAAKQLVAFVYNYPPGGDHFGASFLNVPRSLESVSTGLREAGYAVQPLAEAQWIAQLKPLIAAYYPGSDLRALLALNQAAALPLADYQAWFRTLPQAMRERIVAQWGEPARSRYVIEVQGRKVFVIPRLQQGSLSVLPQPPREETLRQGQDPFMHKSKTPLSHHYLAVYLWARQADAVIHFGTHGTQEWAPGKLRALDVQDEALLPLGDVPVIYPYIVDNLGEALTAKRRGRALMISHRTPSFAPAGFQARMARMHELMHEWETVDAGPTRQALEKQMLAEFVEHQLHRDLGWTAEQIAANFSGYLELLHPYLDRLAQSSQPKGLAVFGQVPDENARRSTILQMLRQPLVEALGEDIDEAFLIDYDKVATARPARWLDLALKDAQAASRLDLRPPPCAPAHAASAASAATDPVAAVSSAADCGGMAAYVPNRAARKPINSPALLKLAERAQELERRLATEGEIPGLLAGLQGRFVPAAYGGDPMRNPDSLPTGRNLTGLDPNRLPTQQAYEVAQRLFDDWYAEQAKTGRPPQRLALSLWAGETLRHQGLMEAQAFAALGVMPVWDDSGRPTGIKVLPLAALKHPRVDVLLSITGSYRDQFPALMSLLDKAVAAAAAAESAESGNAVARNTATVAAELRRQGLGRAEAQALAQARVFGNASGDYGTGVSDAVQADGLKNEDQRLGQLFLQRMSQPYVNGEPLKLSRPGVAAQALGAHLRQTDAALMSRSSHLYSMLSSDDPFQYLGGLSAAAKAAGRKEGLSLHVSQLQDSSEIHTESAARGIALEMQSRYLHPGWLKAQQAEGWAGTLQMLKAVQYAWGWQAVAPQTVRPDHWQSLYDTLVRDKQQLGIPQWLNQNKQAYAQALERMIQAQRLGYWKPDAATRAELATRYQDLTRAAPLHQELAGVRQWASDQAPQAVFEAAPQPPAAHKPMPRTAAVAAQPVAPPTQRGLLLEQQPPQDPAPATPALQRQLAQALAWVAMALMMSFGAVWQYRQQRQVQGAA